MVVIGGGFGGLTATRRLARAPVQITLVDAHNHHLFQPLLYQVATAALPPTSIASPLRRVLRGFVVSGRGSTPVIDPSALFSPDALGALCDTLTDARRREVADA